MDSNTPEIKSYLVGGAVRDQLLGLKVKDWDYAVEAPSYNAMLEWIQQNGKIFLEQPQYWTIRAKLNNGKIADYVLCRKDGQYSDGRRPDSVLVGTLYEDLARRDFTVNAIAYDEATNTYIDPFEGQAHLSIKYLRCVGDAYDRFHEDALRMLRALRFSITKGFQLNPQIKEALRNEELLTKLKNNVSLERKREELHKCFAFDSVKTIECLSTYIGVTDAIFSNTTLWLMPTTKEK